MMAGRKSPRMMIMSYTSNLEYIDLRPKPLSDEGKRSFHFKEWIPYAGWAASFPIFYKIGILLMGMVSIFFDLNGVQDLRHIPNLFMMSMESSMMTDNDGVTQNLGNMLFLKLTKNGEGSRSYVSKNGDFCLIELDRTDFTNEGSFLVDGIDQAYPVFLHEKGHCAFPSVDVFKDGKGKEYWEGLTETDQKTALKLANEAFADVYALMSIWNKKGERKAQESFKMLMAARLGETAQFGTNNHSTEGALLCAYRSTNGFTGALPDEETVREIERKCAFEGVAVVASNISQVPAYDYQNEWVASQIKNVTQDVKALPILRGFEKEAELILVAAYETKIILEEEIGKMMKEDGGFEVMHVKGKHTNRLLKHTDGFVGRLLKGKGVLRETEME